MNGLKTDSITQAVPSPAEPLAVVASACLGEVQTCHTLMDAIMRSVFGREARDASEDLKLESMENVLHEARTQAKQLRVRLDEFISALAG